MNKALLKELMELNPAERIQLAEDLWDSIAADEMPPLSDEQMERWIGALLSMSEALHRRCHGRMYASGFGLAINETACFPSAGTF
jgi:hypothetical protein